MNRARTALRWLLLAAVVIAAGGCTRGPEPALVQEAVQQQLDAALGGRVLEVASFRLAGSAPIRNPDGRLAYFNVSLKLAGDYDFTRWDAHTIDSLRALLGAGPKGLIGLKPEGNKAGDVIGAYGTAAFAQAGDRWNFVTRAQTAASAPEARTGEVPVVQPQAEEQLPPSSLQAALARLVGLQSVAPGMGLSVADRDTILHEEFDRTYVSAKQRLRRAADLVVIAGGPTAGAYEETMKVLEARAKQAGIELAGISSEGSVGNLRLLAEHSAQFALAQNDVARTALLGTGRFASSPHGTLRAVASLFPEPVHLVAGAKSGIRDVADLKGKRVGLGPDGSGTRANAIAVLAANGIPLEALAEAGDTPVPAAIKALSEGRLDAIFVTNHAPAARLQRLGARTRLTWVPIAATPQLVDSGLVPITLPPRTYPGQDAPLATVAATALLVTRADVSSRQVERLLPLLFETHSASEPAAAQQISTRTARDGVTIPWSPTADAWLAAHGAPAKTASPAAP